MLSLTWSAAYELNLARLILSRMKRVFRTMCSMCWSLSPFYINQWQPLFNAHAKHGKQRAVRAPAAVQSTFQASVPFSARHVRKLDWNAASKLAGQAAACTGPGLVVKAPVSPRDSSPDSKSYHCLHQSTMHPLPAYCRPDQHWCWCCYPILEPHSFTTGGFGSTSRPWPSRVGAIPPPFPRDLRARLNANWAIHCACIQ